jgi:hypothetical protein
MAKIIPEGTIAMRKCHWVSEFNHGWQACDAAFSGVLGKCPAGFGGVQT